MTDTITIADPPTPSIGGKDRLRRWVRDDRAWLISALGINLLIGWGGEDASPVAWLNPLVFVAALLIRFRDTRRGPGRLQLRGWRAVGVMLVIGWMVGMLIEFTLTTDGDGFGGLHPDTVPSFILAQGYYLPAVLFTWAATRRYGLDTRRAFFFAGAMAWWEALTFGVVAMLSPFFFLAPFLLAYYVATYALCGMGGLLVVDASTVGSSRSRSISDRRLLGYGAIAGAAAWVIFMAWAVLASHLFGFSL